jgi:hypothetical protein
VLLTRSPLEYPPKEAFPLDLHVLGTPPAFVLSQDQTLREEALGARPHRPEGQEALIRPVIAGLERRRGRLCELWSVFVRQPSVAGAHRDKVVLIPRGTRNDGFKRTWL